MIQEILWFFPRTAMDSFLMARIDQLLEERNGRITNHELAQILNYDGSYIGRIVKKATGKSLFEYSMTFTMAAAETMLRSTEMSISQIAKNFISPTGHIFIRSSTAIII